VRSRTINIVSRHDVCLEPMPHFVRLGPNLNKVSISYSNAKEHCLGSDWRYGADW
jgi:hypothetical protein